MAERLKIFRNAYGWRDFDPRVVDRLVARDVHFVDRRADGSLVSPLRRDGGQRLPWSEEGFSVGTVLHGDPPARFRVSPTYVLRDPLANFIVGHDLIADLLAGHWGKAEISRLGNENSEDAVTWNVLRFLQEAQLLTRAAEFFTGEAPLQEPTLYMWGRRIELHYTAPWEDLARVRNDFEPTHRQQTEPDACLHIPRWGWVFLEAKFGSPTSVYKKPARVAGWLALWQPMRRRLRP